MVICAAGLSYRYLGTGTAIADMAGWVPDGTVTPANFGATTSTATDYSANVQAAMTWCAANGKELIFDAVYRADGVLQVSNLTCRGVNGGGIASYAVVTDTSSGVSGQHVVTGDGHTNFKWLDMLFDNSVNTRHVSGLRTLSFWECDNYVVEGCRFKTGGAAVASVACHHYRVANNYTTIETLYTDVVHDGVIDQWWGSHDFEVIGNTIEAVDFPGRWPILVTGTEGTSTAAKCYNFTIERNKIVGFVYAGIWSMGRTGGCENVRIVDNDIDGNGQSVFSGSSIGSGIAVTETYGAVVAGNNVRDTASNGIHVKTEAGGYTPDQTAITVSNNIVIDANSSAQSGENGAGIVVSGDGLYIVIGSNVVVGSAHTYPLFIDGGDAAETTMIVSPGAYQTGTTGGVVFSNTPTQSGGMVVNAGNQHLFAQGLLRGYLTGSAFEVRGHTTETQGITVGRERTGDGRSEVRLHTDSSGNALLFLTAYAGANGIREIRSMGTGAFQVVTADGGAIICTVGANERFRANSTGLGFFGVTPVARPNVTGSRGGNAALASLLTQLASLGLITDGSSA